MSITRRDALRAAGAGLLGPTLLSSLAHGRRGKTQRVLFFTKSSGFQHSAITRMNGQLGHAERILTDIGRDQGFEVVASKDGRLFDPGRIGEWDAFAFYTTGDLTTPGPHNDGQPMSADGKKAFLDAIHSGKGFIGFHSATDTFHSQGNEVDPYIRMIGGEFISHGPQQVARIRVADTDFPGAGAFGTEFEINDEWYALKNLPDDLRVVMVQLTKGMRSGRADEYNRPDFPETWARLHGKGRVFYTSMGHREDVWTNPKYQGLVLGGLKWITGQVDTDVTPNVDKVTPGYRQTSA